MGRFKVKRRYISRKNLLSLLKYKWSDKSDADFNIERVNDVLRYSAPVKLTSEEIKDAQSGRYNI